MEVNEELNKLEKTGDFVLGSKEALKATESARSKLTILSATCPQDVEEKLMELADDNDVPLHFYEGGSEDLGLALGKPFLVSAMAVIDPGDSSVLELGGNYK